MASNKPKREEPFRFKQFSIAQDRCSMKVGTDGVLLGAWANTEQAASALDIGTGTGLIAIMLGQRLPEAQIHAVEIDEIACEQARENAETAPWSDRLHIHQESIQDFTRRWSDTFDLIVSNPPFFTGGTFSDKQGRNSVRHTVKLPHSDLLISVRRLLAPDGRFCLILPLIEGLRFRELAETYQLYCTRITEVHPKADKPVERLLLQFEREPKACQTDKLIIQKEKRNDWRKEYVELTKDFYLYM